MEAWSKYPYYNCLLHYVGIGSAVPYSGNASEGLWCLGRKWFKQCLQLHCSANYPAQSFLSQFFHWESEFSLFSFTKWESWDAVSWHMSLVKPGLTRHVYRSSVLGHQCWALWIFLLVTEINLSKFSQAFLVSLAENLCMQIRLLSVHTAKVFQIVLYKSSRWLDEVLF